MRGKPRPGKYRPGGATAGPLARGPYATEHYLRRYGEPKRGTGLSGHDLVLYQPFLSGNSRPILVGEPIHRGRIVASVHTSLMLRAMIDADIGIGEVPVHLGERDGLVRIWPELSRDAAYEGWLVTHQDLRHTARVRAMTNAIVARFEVEDRGV